jgi:hypothetical protein
LRRVPSSFFDDKKESYRLGTVQHTARGGARN